MNFQTDDWNKAVKYDGKFISGIAQHPGLRPIFNGYLYDVGESATTWFATRMRTDRQPAVDVCLAEKSIPNRMDYFDTHLSK